MATSERSGRAGDAANFGFPSLGETVSGNTGWEGGVRIPQGAWESKTHHFPHVYVILISFPFSPYTHTRCIHTAAGRGGWLGTVFMPRAWQLPLPHYDIYREAILERRTLASLGGRRQAFVVRYMHARKMIETRGEGRSLSAVILPGRRAGSQLCARQTQ